MFSFKYVKNSQYILIIICLIINTKAYLVFPLNTFREKNFTKVNNSLNFSSEDLLNYWLPNQMYTHIYMGSPPSKIYAFLDHENYGSYLDNSICPLPSRYNNYSSISFKSISNYIITFSYFSNMCFAKETFFSYTDFNFDERNLKPMENLTFLYAIKPKEDSLYSKLYGNKDITGYSCFHIGLQIPETYNYYESLILQLKKNDFIESTYWTIEFKNNDNKLFEIYDNDIEAFLILGLPPHKYNKNKYNENNFRNTISQLRIKNYDDYRVNIWGIIFDKIYIKKKNNNTEIIFQTTKCKFDFGINLIEGSSNYLKNIENEFFDELYNRSICFKEKKYSEKYGIYFVIWCKKNFYEEIKKFPALYFKSNELEYIFELNYEDLFSIKGDKIFFFVFFRSQQGMFTFGKLFFKKYFFTFSFDNKIIGFYNDKINSDNSNKHHIKNGTNSYFDLKDKIIFFILCIAFVFLILIAFIKLRRRYLTERQKRMNELIDNNFVYMSNKTKDNFSSNYKSIGILEN